MSVPARHALFDISHSAPSGACGFSAPVAELALVRADTSPPSVGLRLSGMSRKKSHLGCNSKGSLERRPRNGLDGVASPSKARGARPSRGRRREPYQAHRAPRVPRETLDRSSVRELAAARSRASAHAVIEGASRGRAWRRRRRLMLGKRRMSTVGLGKVDERQAQVCAHMYTMRARLGQVSVWAMILEIASYPASGRSDSRALLSRRTVVRR
ncbi:hypothetical protein T492DRAFT_1104386 [Pavlovales sp. CCMP2436]|nr:hypothetical protein T492DRAFT_1104386 [Pavlovales sp. CCMP2436]